MNGETQQAQKIWNGLHYISWEWQREKMLTFYFGTQITMANDYKKEVQFSDRWPNEFFALEFWVQLSENWTSDFMSWMSLVV